MHVGRARQRGGTDVLYLRLIACPCLGAGNTLYSGKTSSLSLRGDIHPNLPMETSASRAPVSHFPLKSTAYHGSAFLFAIMIEKRGPLKTQSSVHYELSQEY